MKLGEQSIKDIKIDLKSRDDIPKILLGLQHIHNTPEIREEVFQVLEELRPNSTKDKSQKADPQKRPNGNGTVENFSFGCITPWTECRL